MRPRLLELEHELKLLSLPLFLLLLALSADPGPRVAVEDTRHRDPRSMVTRKVVSRSALRGPFASNLLPYPTSKAIEAGLTRVIASG